jgi:hypothetical protein
MQGRIVLSKQTTGNIINERAASLGPGMYLFEIIIHGKKQIIKLVKNQ